MVACRWSSAGSALSSCAILEAARGQYAVREDIDADALYTLFAAQHVSVKFA